MRTPDLDGIPGATRDASDAAAEAAAMLNSALGDGYATATDLRTLPGRGGFVVQHRAVDGSLLWVGTAIVLDSAGTGALMSRLRSAGVTCTVLAGHRIGELKSSAVAAPARGRGIGTALLDARLQKLRDAGCRFVVGASWVSADTGHRSLGLLRRAGFTPLATIAGYWAEDQRSAGYTCPDCGPDCVCAAVIMVKDFGSGAAPQRHG